MKWTLSSQRHPVRLHSLDTEFLFSFSSHRASSRRPGLSSVVRGGCDCAIVRLGTGARSTLGKLAAFVHVQPRIIEPLLQSASRCSYRELRVNASPMQLSPATLHSAFSSAYASQPPCRALHWASRRLSPSLLTASKMAKRPFSLRHLLSRDGAAIHKNFGNAQRDAMTCARRCNDQSLALGAQIHTRVLADYRH
jgi:hypothetical protein